MKTQAMQFNPTRWNLDRKPLNMSDEMYKLAILQDKTTNQADYDAIEDKIIALDYAELEQAEQNLALSEFGYKKWGR